MRTLKKELIDLGMAEKEIDSWASDLYVKKNSISDKFVAEYEFKNSVTIFRDNIEHELWYEIPFGNGLECE